MFYNIPDFLVKLALFNKFMASFLLIPLIIQPKSQCLMFKIAISLNFRDIIEKSWHPFQTFG